MVFKELPVVSGEDLEVHKYSSEGPFSGLGSPPDVLLWGFLQGLGAVLSGCAL